MDYGAKKIGTDMKENAYWEGLKNLHRYPGARWWKFDFHTHTPASDDTPWKDHPIIVERWLTKFMEADIDCVVVSDHNSGNWIDELQSAYARMEALANAGTPLNGFRPLTIFPGVEISAHDGVHILAVFDPDSDKSRIDDVLARARFPVSAKGKTGAVTKSSVPEVLQAIHEAGGIAIPAHIDSANAETSVGKGLLKMDTLSMQQSLDDPYLYAVEQIARDVDYPEQCRQRLMKLTKVLGSDCHSFQGAAVPGSRYTWIKMEKPDLEGLRLALLDGNDVSVIRSCEEPKGFDPLRVPENIITSIDVKDARFLGRGESATIRLSPYFNVLVGGRGTGKSTFVHALRLAMQRGEEVTSLGADSQAAQDFSRFSKIYTKRSGSGALLDSTCITVDWKHDDSLLRVKWRSADKTHPEIEECTKAEWLPSESQSISHDRFPLKIYSQGQIAALADTGRNLLLQQIDQASGADVVRQALEDVARRIESLGAKKRELSAKIAQLPEVQRKLSETQKKLTLFAKNNQDEIWKKYSRTVRQVREIKNYVEQLKTAATELRSCRDKLQPDDWPPVLFDSADPAEAEVLQWRETMDHSIYKLMQHLLTAADRLQNVADTVKQDPRIRTWLDGANQVGRDYQAMKSRLAAEGVSDPDAFARLTKEQQQLQEQEKTLRRHQTEQEQVSEQYQVVCCEMRQLRKKLTTVRQAFVSEQLKDNDYVRIEVIPLGFDIEKVATELRQLLEIDDGTFVEDLVDRGNEKQAPSGLLRHWVSADEIQQRDMDTKLGYLDELKGVIFIPELEESLQGRFRKKLGSLMERPEFQDHVETWYPGDDLAISYRRGKDWASVKEGSQGQRSAALLAFLLAFGNEPLVLDQPEDDLDNHLIYDLIVKQIRENKLRRQLLIVTHNPNIVVNGDAEEVHVMEFGRGQCYVKQSGSLQNKAVREEVCQVMEGGREAFRRRWERLGKEF